MIKIIFICDKCKKQKTYSRNISSGYERPEGWHIEFNNGMQHYCSKKCIPRFKKVKHINRSVGDNDPGVGSLYGRT